MRVAKFVAFRGQPEGRGKGLASEAAETTDLQVQGCSAKPLRSDGVCTVDLGSHAWGDHAPGAGGLLWIGG